MAQLLIWKANVTAMRLHEENEKLVFKIVFYGYKNCQVHLGILRYRYTPQGVHDTSIFYFYFNKIASRTDSIQWK